MRSSTFSIEPKRLQALAVSAAAGMGLAFIILWGTRHLEPRFLISLLAGLSFILGGIATGRFERALFCLFFFMIPLNVDIHWHLEGRLRTGGGGYEELGISTLDIFLIFLYIFWIARIVVTRPSFTEIWPAGGGLLLFFIFWCSVTLFNAREPLIGFFSVISLMKAFLYFFYISNHVRTREDLWFVARCLMAGLIVESCIGLAQHVKGGNLGLPFLGERRIEKEVLLSMGNVFRIGGTLGHPNNFGGYLASVIPLALALNVTRLNSISRALCGTALFLGTVTLILTYSRSAWLVTGVACLILLGFLLFFGYVHFRLGPVLMAVLILGITIGFFGSSIKDRWSADDKGSTFSRVSQAKMAWSMVRTHPFLGVGINNYMFKMRMHEPYIPDRTTTTRLNRVHNIFLLVAAETGVLGFLWFLLFLGAAFLRGWGKIAAVQDEWWRLMLLGILLSLAARLVHDAFHTGFLGANTLLWAHSACLSTRLKREEEI